jgi:DNA recombination protein RmuC
MSSATLALVVAIIAALAALAAVWAALRASSGGSDASRATEALRSEMATRSDALQRSQADAQALLLQQLTATQGLLQQRLEAQESVLREQLAGQSTAFQGQAGILQKHMEGTQATLSQVREKMGEVQQATLRMGELGREIEELQRLLKAPKQRGTLGEAGLEMILGDILPKDRVVFQHAFSDGRKVDAVVRLDKGLLPIDAKFPVEDFLRFIEASDEERPKARKALLANLKKKIDEIAKLYIRPEEGTLPLALMYLPSESLYYETFVARGRDEEDLWQYAHAKSVLPLSPGTLSAYLRSVSLGLRAAAVEENARLVLQILQALEQDVAAFRRAFETMGTHLSNAHKQYDESSKGLQKLANRLERARDLGSGKDEAPE